MKVALLVMAFLVVAPHLNAATISPVADRAGCNRGNDRLPSVFIYDAPFTSVTGNIIRTNLPVHGIVTGPPVFITHQSADFGPLPQGTYTYEVHQTFGESVLISRQTIVVSPPIPAMSHMLVASCNHPGSQRMFGAG